MIDEILVPLDGSALAGAILPHVIALAHIDGARLTLLHVVETDCSSSARADPVVWSLRKTEAQSYLEEMGERLRRFELTTEHVVLEGSAAERIFQYAQKNEFDLIALTSHGQGGLSGWNLSSVAYKVIQRIRRSTLILQAHRTVREHRPNEELVPLHYERILVPLDGSSRAECVLSLAETLAKQHGAQLILAHVITRPEMIQRTPLTQDANDMLDHVVDLNRTAANHYFKQLQERLSPSPTTRILEADNVERALLDLANKENADLVILAAHGHSGDNERAYGRLADSFIEYSTVPLYIYQDLDAEEIAPLYAERMLQELEPSGEQRIKVNENVAK